VNEDRSTRYNRLKRRVGVASLAWGIVFLLALLLSRGSVALRTTAESIAGAIAPDALVASASVVAYVVLLTLLNEIGSIPLAF
jgi:hypothetical protein